MGVEFVQLRPIVSRPSYDLSLLHQLLIHIVFQKSPVFGLWYSFSFPMACLDEKHFFRFGLKEELGRESSTHAIDFLPVQALESHRMQDRLTEASL